MSSPDINAALPNISPLCCNALHESGCKSPSIAALVTIWLRTSMTKIKSIGDNGSPCLNPCRWIIFPLGIPFISTWVEEVARSPLIKALQICPKPKHCRTSNKNSQATESKALEMSSLRRIRGSLWWWKTLPFAAWSDLWWMHFGWATPSHSNNLPIC